MERSGSQKRSETVRNGHANGQERWYAERSGTPRNVRVGTQQRFGTNSGKRSRCVHGTFTFTFQKRKKHCI
jgi:hypothetical protein